MGVEVRRATAGEAEAIARIHVESWRAAYRGIFPGEYLDGLDWRDRVEPWRNEIRDPEKGVLVAVEGAVTLGFAGFGPSRDEDPGTAGWVELYAIYLDPGRWARGIGGALLRRVLEEAPQIMLWVLEGNERAVRFYERHGFVPDGARKGIERGGRSAAQVRYVRSGLERDWRGGADGTAARGREDRWVSGPF